MTEYKLRFHKTPDTPRLEPSTCVEAETYALRVLDDSMQPEFRTGCIIVIDPTGHAKEGSYVLATSIAKKSANTSAHSSANTSANTPPRMPGAQSNNAITIDEAGDALEPLLFRQLRQQSDGAWMLYALNEDYAAEPTAADFSDILGVIVQRAGTRRRYHKHYA